MQTDMDTHRHTLRYLIGEKTTLSQKINATFTLTNDDTLLLNQNITNFIFSPLLLAPWSLYVAFLEEEKLS